MRARLRVACALGLSLGAFGTTGCERLLSIHDPVAGDGRSGDDAGDDSMIDAGPPPSSPILLSEVVVSPSAGEMIEIVNTSNDVVDLSSYYLSDSGNYYRLPVAPLVDSTDFIVRFPSGTKIKAHGVLTIAIDLPANFATTYGASPDFSVADQSMDRIMVNGIARLTDGGEPIILFQWDGHSDLVRDVDIMMVGMPSSANALPSKSGMSQDGIDADTRPSSYATDLNSISVVAQQQPAAPGTGLSTKRIALEDGHEVHNGNGNGQAGDDETSEKILETWDGTGAMPFTAPTPGVVPMALLR
jgi:hypothetical protein